MGAGVVMKGGHGNMQYMHGTQQHNKRYWNVYLLTFIVMLLFGAAVLGLMGLHRLREKRVFNLLIKEKHDRIISLQFLLQKERVRVQENKMKINEMKMKTQSLRAQKTELMGRVSEMESTISSLKDEQRIIELAFQEKQNEAKLLRERYTQVVNDQNPRVKSLTDILRHKEAEIEDLKPRLIDSPPAVSVDGSSKELEETKKRGIGNRLEEGKPIINQLKTEDNLSMSLSVQDHESNLKNQQFGINEQKSSNLRGYYPKENTTSDDNIEDSSTGIRLQNHNSIKPIDTDQDLSRNVVNSNLVSSHFPMNGEVANYAKTGGETTKSSGDGTVRQVEENDDESKDEDTENNDDDKHPGQTEVVQNKNEDPAENEMDDSGETE